MKTFVKQPLSHRLIECWADAFYSALRLTAYVIKLVIESKCAKGFILMVGVKLIAWLVFHDGEVLGSLAAVCVMLLAGVFIENSENWRN